MTGTVSIGERRLDHWHGPGDAEVIRQAYPAKFSLENKWVRPASDVRRLPNWEKAPAGFYPDTRTDQYRDEGEAVVVVEWLVHPGKDRLVRVARPFIFRDMAGRLWRVPAGFISDGASIPRVFWWLIGHPLMGDYRRAALVHDFACEMLKGKGTALTVTSVLLDEETELRPWYLDARAVHRTLYDGCTVDTLTSWKRDVMYWAVDRYGPQGEK